MGRRLVRLDLLVGAVLVFVGVLALGAAPAGARTAGGIIPPNNPPKSIPPNPDFEMSSKCVSYPPRPNGSVSCDLLVLKAITNARKKEGLGPMRFNLTAYRKLSVVEQLFVTADLERVDRGLQPVEALTHQLDDFALQGAQAAADPILPYLPYSLQGGGSVWAFGSNWSGGGPNVLASDYGWMYDDGPNSPNYECPHAGAPKCWGHRDNILGDTAKNSWGNPAYCGGGSYHFVMGTASTKSKNGWDPSQTELFVLDCGRAPTEYFTWARAKQLLGI